MLLGPLEQEQRQFSERQSERSTTKSLAAAATLHAMLSCTAITGLLRTARVLWQGLVGRA